REDAQRMVDILGGAIQALRGDMKAITNNVFVVSPSTVQLTTPPMGQQTYNQHDFKAHAREYAYVG
ncbi:MAG: cell division protein SepF, partial [Chloroflexi bacterium]|nr:cell division protein SepF [Chloroflexota bacterium]